MMRALTLLGLLGILLLEAAVPAWAENDILSIIRGDYQRRQQRDNYLNGLPPQRPRPVKPRLPRPVQPQPQPETSTPAIAPSNFISVMGDQMADSLADEVIGQLKSRSDVSISARTRPSWGLVRSDWSEAVAERLALADRIDAAVIMIGANDREAIDDAGKSVAPDKPEWRGLYAKRVDTLLAQFKAKNIQVFWVGLPPMRDRQLNATVVVLNEIYQEQVEKAGGTYVDIWAAFADEDGGYEASGPDINGQPAKLRMGDGVRFAKAGASVAAHYVERSLRRALINSTEPDQSVPSATDPSADIGMVRRLNDIESSPGGVLLGKNRPSAPVASAGARVPVAPSVGASPATQVFVRGEPLTPKPGRADDYRWPLPSSELKTSGRSSETETSTR